MELQDNDCANDTMEIAELEYDVGGVNAVEAAPHADNQAASFLVHYRTPSAC